MDKGSGAPVAWLRMFYNLVGGLVTWGGSGMLSAFLGQNGKCLALTHEMGASSWMNHFCWRHEVALFL